MKKTKRSRGGESLRLEITQLQSAIEELRTIVNSEKAEVIDHPLRRALN
jgi:hypothetical protein